MKLFQNKYIFKTLLLFTILSIISCSKDKEDPTPTEITITTSGFSKTIDENPTNYQVIGIVEGSTNEGSVSFSITEQTPSGAFSIDAASGELKVADETLFDFETNPSITGTVKVANGAVSKNASINITLNDVSEANIYEGDLILKTQEEVNLFGANQYTKITGTLWVGNPEEGSISDISDLSPLHSLLNIAGDLWIINNPNLISTLGLNLHNLEGKLVISVNSSLEKVEGLNNLTSASELALTGNDILYDMSGLSQLSGIGDNIAIITCPKIGNLDWLANLTALGNNLTIRNCTSMENIDGLSNLINLTGEYPSFFFTNNTSLTNLNGLRNLNTTLLRLELGDNPSLINIEGLEKLNVKNRLYIHGNHALKNLNGLESITSLSYELFIKYNNSLNDIQGLRNLLSSYDTQIFNNESLINLEGLNSLAESPLLDISGNTQLIDYCALQNLFSIAPPYDFHTEYNAYNPTKQDIIDGNCSL